jgi:hypothetical protein
MPSSGKLVIVGILTIALASAAASWWFRYSATHRAAEFWGPEVSHLIRDAPIVRLCRLKSAENEIHASAARIERGTAHCADVRQAKGLTHLRNALLEDRSFHWSKRADADKTWRWALVFRDDERRLECILLFSDDGSQVTVPPAGGVLSCSPISSGLLEMFHEMAAESDVR